MSLKSTAQSVSGMPFLVIEQGENSSEPSINVEPNGFSIEEPANELSVSEHDGDHQHEHDLEIDDSDEDIVVIELDEIPGAGSPGPIIEKVLEVSEEDSDDKTRDSDNLDENYAKKSKKNPKWDWESKGAEGFVAWVKERFDTVPKHSGYDTAGLERAVSYLEKLDSEISRAMRLDLEEELDANKVEEIRSKIEDGIDRLHDRLDKIKKTKKNKRKKTAQTEHESFIKEGQKITGVQGIYIMAPLFASRIARICINGSISAGHDIEDIFAKQTKKWALTDREQAEVMQLLADMGYPLRQDRGYMPDEDFDISVDDQFDWSAQYKA